MEYSVRNPRVRKIWNRWVVLVWYESGEVWMQWTSRDEWRPAFDAARFYAQDKTLGA